MANVYFIFKPLRIQGMGGLFPHHLNVNIQASQGEWYLGSIDQNDYFKLKDDYCPMPVTAEEADGFKLIGVTQMLIDPSDPESETRDLTAEELASQALGEALLEKISTRSEIEVNVGDLYDLLADLTKLLSFLIMEVGSADLQNIVSAYIAQYDSADTKSKLTTRFGNIKLAVSDYKLIKQ